MVQTPPPGGPKLTPEEIELGNKRAQLVVLESELAQQELDLATLKAELGTLERRYLGTIGVLYAERDELEAQLAEIAAKRDPHNHEAQRKAAEARDQASQSADEGRRDQDAPEAGFRPSDELKRLFREVAKRIHPDLTTDPEERAKRQTIMAEANKAYAAGDAVRLQAILQEWESRPESVAGEGAGAELVRVIRKIAQVERRLSRIEEELDQLRKSDLYQLKIRIDEAADQGRDLIAELVLQAETELKSLKSEFTSRGHAPHAG